MQYVSCICYADDEGKRAHYLCSVYRNNIGHQAEYADRRKLDDHHEDFHGDLIHTVYKLCDPLSLNSGCKYARSEEYGDTDNGQHIGLDHRFYKIVGENADYDVHDLWGFSRIILKATGDALVESREEAFKAVDYYEADNYCKGGR